jgi:hypothetical protein
MEMKKIIVAITVLGSAILASFCCLPVIGAAIFGLGFGIAGALAGFRTFFIVLNILTLVIAGYFTYRQPKKCCDVNKKCCDLKKKTKIFFWAVVVINFLILAYPYL